MSLFFRAIFRLFVLAFGYVSGCLAAMAVLVAAIVGWRARFGETFGATPEEEVIGLILSTSFGLIAFFHIAINAFIPALAAGLVSEAFSLRSVIYYIGFGGVIAVYLLSSSSVYDGETLPQQEMVISLAAGFVAGIVYWLIAGRRAGIWRGGG